MFEIATFIVLTIVGYTVGSRREAKHYAEILDKEKELLYMPVRADKILLPGAAQGHLMMGSVVIANDYFKMVATSVKSFLGGTLRSQETLLDRGRREATLRLKLKAKAYGADEIVGFRMETAMLDKAGVEIFVYGTAIKNAIHTKT
jgi:uncharacterized protein YbjQ (UPF0145 family)